MSGPLHDGGPASGPQGRFVFVTGATGTIGSALVPRLLACAGTRVLILVRARDDNEMALRLEALHTHWGHTQNDPRRRSVQAWRGDVTAPNLGLGQAALDLLIQRCSHIIHCAASVKLNMGMDEARRTAVTPTRTVLALAHECADKGRLQKVDLVSTVGVWGRTPGAMPERPLTEVTEFHNTYEAAKFEAEGLAWSARQDLPVTVHRPSMVVGRSSDGLVIHFQVFYHLCEFLSGTRTFGIMPTLGHTRLDTVPVDWVADAIAWASEHEETAGQVMHLCSGPQHSLPITDLQQMVRQLWQQQGRRLPRLLTLDRRWLERLIPLIGTVAGHRTRRALRGLPPVLAYLAEDQSFSNSHTLQRLSSAGLALPDPRHYLPRVLDHYLQVQRSAGPRP